MRSYFAMFTVGLGLVGGCLARPDDTPVPAAIPGFVLEVEISGMFALVPSVDQSMLRILGVRADDASNHGGLAHRAHLLIPCDALTVPAMGEQCRKHTGGWELVKEATLPQGLALNPGYDLRVEADGTADGVVRSVVLGDYLVDLGRFAAHPSLLAATVDDEVRKRSVVRLDLDRGFLDIGQLERREGWSLVTIGDPLQEVARHRRMAGTLSWKIPVFAAEAVLELKPHATKGAGQRIKISPPAGERHVRVILSNEPSVEDFCSQEPSPETPLLHHFLGFYQLLAAVPPAGEQILPRYDGQATYCDKPDTWGGGWPRICQKPFLAATWEP